MVTMGEARGKKALPREASDELEFAGVVEVLRILEGENVCLVILFTDRPNPSEVRIQGPLGQRRDARGHGFDIGSAHLLLREEDFVKAHLTTYDGNDFFHIGMQFGDQSFLIGDVWAHGDGE